MAAEFDYIVIGSGINGLVAACYLLLSGGKVIIFEKLDHLGGAAYSEEITLPGFMHDVMATSINSSRISIILEELKLANYGYRAVRPNIIASTPFKNGNAVTMHMNVKKTIKSIEKFSKTDAKKYKDCIRFYRSYSEVVSFASLAAPPPYSEMTSLLEESEKGLDFLKFTFTSARDWLEETFESEEVKGFFALWGSNHAPLSPEEPGSAMTSLSFVGSLQNKGLEIPIGGIKRLIDALINFVKSHGGEIVIHEAVKKIKIKNGVAVGVTTKANRTVFAKKGVFADIEPKSLFLRMIDLGLISERLINNVKHFRFSKVSQVILHAALKDKILFSNEDVSNSALIQIGGSLNDISKAYNECLIGSIPRSPFMTLSNSSLYDPTRAPSPHQIMWNFIRSPTFINGKRWRDNDKESLINKALSSLEEYSPNIKTKIMKMIALSPTDIEIINNNMVNGDPIVGSVALDQSLYFRPFVGASQYTCEIKSLYLCGASMHPGGGISGISGRNAALSSLSTIITE